MKPKSVFASCIVVVITLLSTSATAMADGCPVQAPVQAPCTSRCNAWLFEACVEYCGCNGQPICRGWPLTGGWPRHVSSRRSLVA